MYEVDYTWTFASSVTGPPTSTSLVELLSPCAYTALYCESNTLATTQSFSLQTAAHSSGPWVTEGSTNVPATANASGANVLRLTGPYICIRPSLNTASSGNYVFRLVGMS